MELRPNALSENDCVRGQLVCHHVQPGSTAATPGCGRASPGPRVAARFPCAYVTDIRRRHRPCFAWASRRFARDKPVVEGAQRPGTTGQRDTSPPRPKVALWGEREKLSPTPRLAVRMRLECEIAGRHSGLHMHSSFLIDSLPSPLRAPFSRLSHFVRLWFRHFSPSRSSITVLTIWSSTSPLHRVGWLP